MKQYLLSVCLVDDDTPPPSPEEMQPTYEAVDAFNSRLQQSGVIAGYHAQIDLAALDRTLSALSDIKLKDEIDRHDFERHLVEVPQVLSAIHTTGITVPWSGTSSASER